MKGQVKISMCDYIKEIIATWDKVMKTPEEDCFYLVSRKKKISHVRHPKIYSKSMRTQRSWNRIRQRVSITSLQRLSL